MQLVPLGDQAALAHFADEDAALRFSFAARQLAEPWLVDIVPAYASVAIFFNLDFVNYATVAARLAQFEAQVNRLEAAEFGRLHRIPCCYEYELDLARVAKHTA